MNVNTKNDGLAASTVLGLRDIREITVDSRHEDDAEDEIGAWSM